MKTITTHEAKTHLSRYLAEVEKGARFTIARGKTVVAMLVPVVSATYALAEVGAAFDLMEAGGQMGKIVVTP